MEKKFRLLLLLALLMTAATGAWAQEQWDVVWDFTAWSTETVTALKADAAASKLEGWSDVEKQTDAESGADPTEAAKDNCFWFAGTVNEDGSLSANGAVIKELKGLKFNSDYAAKRSLAIAVNYPSTSLGDYAGGAYLWLGGGGSKQTCPCFTIPGVKAGSKITIEVESNKTSNARGIGLYKNSYAAENLIGEQFTPTAKEAKTWEIAEDCDVVVYNTNSCHIYTIKVKAPAGDTKYTVKMAENTVDKDNWTISPTEAAEGETVTLQYNGRLKVKGVKATSDAAPAAAADNPAPTTAAIDAYTGGAFAWDGDGSAATVDVTINTFAANDGISILSAKNANTKFTTTAGGASATFSGTATDDAKFYAVYPYTAGLTLSGDVISGVVIPSDQWNDKWGNNTENESSWDPKAPIAYATTTGSSLQFHNLCAILIINPYWGGDGWITISADQDLAGTFSLDTSTGTLTATAGSKTVTIGSSSGLMKRVMGMGEYMYIAIAPGEYTNFKVRTDEDHGGAEKTKASVTFEAGKIYNLGKVRPY